MDLKDFFLTEGRMEENKQLSERAKEGFLRAVAEYATYGKKLERQMSLSDISRELGVVAEAAEVFTMNEADDWFDQITIKRNMKELKRFSEDFKKTSAEAEKIENRMLALYEDMGHILNRYFEIRDLSEHRDALEEAKITHDGPVRITELNASVVKRMANKPWFKNLLKDAIKFGEVVVHYTNDSGEDEWETIPMSRVKEFKSHFRNFHVIYNGKTKEWLIK